MRCYRSRVQQAWRHGCPCDRPWQLGVQPSLQRSDGGHVPSTPKGLKQAGLLNPSVSAKSGLAQGPSYTQTLIAGRESQGLTDILPQASQGLVLKNAQGLDH